MRKSIRDLLLDTEYWAKMGDENHSTTLLSNVGTLLDKGYDYDEDLSSLYDKYKLPDLFPKKSKAPIKVVHNIVNKHYSNSASGLLSDLFIVFVVLKLTAIIDWGWWWVLSPAWGLVAYNMASNIVKKIIQKPFKN
jgi:hypothetical protein